MRYKGMNKNIKQTILYFHDFLYNKESCFETEIFKKNLSFLIEIIYQQDRTIKKHYKIINGLRKTNQDQKDTIEHAKTTIDFQYNIIETQLKQIELLQKEKYKLVKENEKHEDNNYLQRKSIDSQQREIITLQNEIKAKNTFLIEKHLTSKYAKWLVEYNKQKRAT